VVVCTYSDNFAAAGGGHAGARPERGAEHCDGRCKLNLLDAAPTADDELVLSGERVVVVDVEASWEGAKASGSSRRAKRKVVV
jgi:hypothetical protein